MHNLAGEAVTMDGVVAAIEAAAPDAAGLIEFDDVLLPFPSEVDAASLADTVGVVAELPFAEGVADAVARFRRLLADGRLTPRQRPRPRRRSTPAGSMYSSPQSIVEARHE